MSHLALPSRLRGCTLPLALLFSSVVGCSGGTPEEPRSPMTAHLPISNWSGSTTTPLLAGRTTQVGQVTAYIEGDQLLVKYVVNAPWSLTETHLDIQNDWRLIPRTKAGGPIPGHFAFRQRHTPGVTEFVYSKALSPDMLPTLYLAAHAEVTRSSGTIQEGAWAAGTRFVERGSWATYFTLTPQVIEEIAQGPDWKLTRVSGTVTDTGAVFNQKLYMVHDANGVQQAPLPPSVREDLSGSLQPGGTVFFVDQHIVDEIAVSEASGQLTPYLLAIAEPPDTPVQFSGCLDQPRSVSKTVGAQFPPLEKSYDFADSLQGKLTFNLNMGATATAAVSVNIVRMSLLGACIPYGLVFVEARTSGSASATSQVSVQGTLKYDMHWSTLVVKPPLINLGFMIGPVPVIIGVNLPVTVGVDLSANATGQLTYTGGQTLTGSFDSKCALSGCTGNANLSLTTVPPATELTGGVSARIQVSPWVQGAIRTFLYDESIVYGQIGVRPTAHGDLWGYIGNNCGDADGDGVPELVSALTFDADGQVFITAAVSGFLNTQEWTDVYHTARKHIAFLSLPNSSALTPMLLGPAETGVGIPQEYRAKMRPCWPYADPVHYELYWGDGTKTEMESPPDITASHAWSADIGYKLSLRALWDKHGRQPLSPHVTFRDITVQPTVEIAIKGTGLGSVTSSPAGINCPNVSCRAFFPKGSQVVLSASPGYGSQFTGWSGGCAGTGTCTVSAAGTIQATAFFAHVSDCPAGTADCNQDASDGCEVNIGSDVNNCGACGNVCPGAHLGSANVACESSLCTFSCRGERFDIDQSAANGCERSDSVPPGHTEGSASTHGPYTCHDSQSRITLSGKILSDARVHANPVIDGFAPVIGAAPDYWAILADGGFCINDLDVRITTTGGGDIECYRLQIITTDLTEILYFSGNGSASFVSGIGSYNDDSVIMLIVDKICSTSVQEYVNYTINLHL